MARNSETLIESVRRVTNIPNAQEKFQDADILAFMYDELLNWVLPYLMDTREDFYTTNHVEDLTSGVSSFRIPSRAVASKLRDVKVKRGDRVYSVPRIPFEDVLTDNLSGSTSNVNFYLQGAFIKLYPTIVNNFYNELQIPYFLRPNQIVTLAEVGVINSIDTVSNTITVGSLPATFSTGVKVDLVKRNGQYDTLQFDLEVMTTGTNSVTLSSSLSEYLEIGDYLCIAEQAPVAQIPEEWQPLLIERTVCKVLQAQNDVEAFKIAQIKLKELEDRAQDLATPRVEGESEVLLNSTWNDNSSRWI